MTLEKNGSPGVAPTIGARLSSTLFQISLNSASQSLSARVLAPDTASPMVPSSSSIQPGSAIFLSVTFASPVLNDAPPPAPVPTKRRPLGSIEVGTPHHSRAGDEAISTAN